jgi:hypothetical protein
MLAIRHKSGEDAHHRHLQRQRCSDSGVWLAIAMLPLIASCTATQVGPDRPITIEEDVANIRTLAEPVGPINVAVRNQIVTARMYIVDLEYHKYEAKLTRDLQEEGLAATLATLGLTSAASLTTVASTSRILSGAATVVTGADKAFSDKILLSNTIQALQTQMRVDRQTQSAVIFAKMVTPIEQYTLPMALSDVDKYYQAGTLASALVGLNRTVANAEQHAATAHDLAGPNGEFVTSLKTVANPPPLGTRAALQAQIIRNVENPLPTPTRSTRITNDPHRIGDYEMQMTNKDIKSLQTALCVKPDGDLGSNQPPLSDTRNALQAYLQSIGEKPSTVVTSRISDLIVMNLTSQKKTSCGK